VLPVVIVILVAIVIFDHLFCNFLPNPTASSYLLHVIWISSAVSAVCLYWRVSPKLENPDAIPVNVRRKKTAIRVLACAGVSLFLAHAIIGSFLPCLYTTITGSEGDILAKVTGWHSAGRTSCARPYVNDQILLSPSAGMCVGNGDERNYPYGTVVRLRGKISTLGINVSGMEIVSDTQSDSR